MRFQGHLAVVAGGAHGIGRAISARLVNEGAHVIVADQALDAAEETVLAIRGERGRAEVRHLDATDASSVGRLFYEIDQAFGSLDLLVNCPAHASDTHFERITESEFDYDIAATLKAPFLCTQAAIPLLLKSSYGANVVSIGSVNGMGAFGNEVYGAAKAGLSNLTKNLAVRYGPLGLRFNIIAAGTTATRTWDTRLIAEPGLLDEVARLYPLGRVGTAEDVAAACAFLASEDAAWITGVTLPVDGGITAGHPGFISETFGSEFFSSMIEHRPNA